MLNKKMDGQHSDFDLGVPYPRATYDQACWEKPAHLDWSIPKADLVAMAIRSILTL